MCERETKKCWRLIYRIVHQYCTANVAVHCVCVCVCVFTEGGWRRLIGWERGPFQWWGGEDEWSSSDLLLLLHTENDTVCILQWTPPITTRSCCDITNNVGFAVRNVVLNHDVFTQTKHSARRTELTKQISISNICQSKKCSWKPESKLMWLATC